MNIFKAFFYLRFLFLEAKLDILVYDIPIYTSLMF
jgi:hypothetical protein